MEQHPRYQLLEKVASGSFATVYRGRDLELGREIAVKQIHDQYLADPQQLDRYWQEAQLLASLQHPNIVTIYDVVRERGWLILELMQGDLSKIAGRRQMPLESLRTTLAHCLRALKFLHAHGIVHGDVKPSNMMVDRRRRIKLGDFGLARRVSDEEGSLVKGTTKYMAPEVVSDEFGDVGAASDLYSLGFAAFELMCGDQFESLFPGLNSFGRDRQTAWMLWHAAPDRRLPEISRLLADVPEDLAKTIQKLTAKSQAERYKTADDALASLNIDLRPGKTGEESVLGLPHAGRSDEARKKRLLAIGAALVSLLASLAVVFYPGGEKPTITAHGSESFAGIVREVLVDEGKLVIEDEQGLPEEVVVGEKPRIRLNDDQYILLRELQPHDRVEIHLDPVDEHRAVRIAALRPVEGHGRLKQVDPAANTLVATLAADPHPQDVPMYVTERAKLFLNGRIATIEDLKPDDRIEVEHILDTAGRAARDVIRLDARRNVDLIGFVREVKEQDDKLWLNVEKHGVVTPLEFGKPCLVTVNGKESGERGAFSPTDLKPGDRVVVTHDTQISAVVAERRGRQTGVLVKIEPSAHEILLRADDGAEVRFTIPEECRILVEDHAAVFDDLRKFDKLEVTFDEHGDGLRAAQTIDARRPKI